MGDVEITKDKDKHDLLELIKEKEEEIMKLFWTPCIFPNSGQFPKALKTPKGVTKNKRKRTFRDVGIKPVKVQESEGSNKYQKKRNNNKGYHISGIKMFQSTLDSEEFFNDWNWNMSEFEKTEDIFADWLWNLDTSVDLRQKFYDDPSVEESYNDFNFWRSLEQPKLSEDEIVLIAGQPSDPVESSVTPESSGTPDSGFSFSLKGEEEKGKASLNNWLNWAYWEDSYQNETILQSLLEDEVQESMEKRDAPVNFWDESAKNQANNELLMKKKENEAESLSKFLWDDKEIIFALVSPRSGRYSPQYFPWEDPDTMAGLMEASGKPSRRTSDDSTTFLWDDPAAIGMLLTDEEDEAYLPWDDKMDMVGQTEQLPSTLEEAEELPKPWEWLDKDTLLSLVGEEPSQHNSWEQWSLWDQFGSCKEIMQAYEEVTAVQQEDKKVRLRPPLAHVNIDEAFWNITMSDTNAETRRLTKETENLPPWHSPDVYADAWDQDTPKQSQTRRSGNQHKDPLNTFKAYRYIFYENDHIQAKSTPAQETKVETIFDDMLDIYADWAPKMLSDERVEKKRQRRGRGRGVKVPGTKVYRVPITLTTERSHQTQRHQANTTTAIRPRPGTPTIVTKKMNKVWDFEASWIETKQPKKDRKTSQGWKTGRTQRQLHSKMYAKQPRSAKSAFPA